MNWWKHLKTILIHKYYVGKYCFKAGLYWQGIVHDLSKFSLTEFLESVKYFQGTSSPIPACKKDKGYSLAWQHHKGRNPHHYEYWTDNYDFGTTTIEIPSKYLKELICDYLGACKAYTKCSDSELFKKELTWWLENKDKKLIHPNSKDKITLTFSRLSKCPDKFRQIMNKI